MFQSERKLRIAFGLLVGLFAGLASAAAQTAILLPNWAQQSPAISPAGRGQAAMTYDAAHQQIVLFGGAGSGSGDNLLGDTWTWNGSTWTQQSPSAGPVARYDAMMAYDAAHQQVVLFGGAANTGQVGDTWVWNGSSWTQVSSSGPTARALATMAWDPVHQQLLLFGGFSSSFSGGNVYLNDTWIWNGSTWTQLDPAHNPTARAEATMAWDSADQQMVLFGGSNNGANLGDTWTWNGTDWTQQAPATSPTARVQAAMAYDSTLNEVVLFGGVDTSGELADTWTWKGGNWTQQQPLNAASTRTTAVMADFPPQQQVLLFGGADTSGALGDTWTYQLPGNMGTANVCPSGTAPSPCSQSSTLAFQFTVAATGITPSVVTQGAQNLDFTDLHTGTCDLNGPSHAYNVGDICTVNVQFTPKYPGTRYGAATLLNASGAAVATAYIYGTGVGPQLVFPGYSRIEFLGRGFFLEPYGVAVDAAGNVYVADYGSNAVKKMPPGCTLFTCVTTIGGTLTEPYALAVDGSGNVYVAAPLATVVTKIPPGCASAGCVTTVGAGFNSPVAVAVDGTGNVYVADSGDGLKKMPPGCTSATCVTTLAGGHAWGVAVDGTGNVYFSPGGQSTGVKEIPAGCTSSACITTLGAGLISPGPLALDPTGDIYAVNLGGLIELPPGCMSYACMTSFGQSESVAVDGSGNVYRVDPYNAGQYAVTELTLATPSKVAFADTAMGYKSSDSPKSITVQNIGNAPLILAVPVTGKNPSVSANFQLDSSSTCPEVLTSSSAGVLAAGANCNLALDFVPTSPGLISGSAVLTDNNLNATPSTTQSIGLAGNGLSPTLTPTVTVTPSLTSFNTNQNLTLTVTVTGGTGNPVPTGTFTLNAPGFNTGAIPLANGTFSYTISKAPYPVMALGTDTITASYSGDSNYYAASGSTVVTFSLTPGSVYVSESPTSITTLQSTVIGTSVGCWVEGNFGNITVTFQGKSVGKFIYSGDFSQISVPGSALPLGTDTLTVTWAGNSACSSASKNIDLTVTAPVYPDNNAGAISLGSSNTTPVTVTFNTTQALGSTQVVTQGALGLDLTDAGTGSCATNGYGRIYNTGDTCTVNVIFAPKHAGARYGAVNVRNIYGAVVATSYVYGTGIGPHLIFPSNQSIQTLGGGFNNPGGIATDNAGNLYIADSGNSAVKKMPAGCVSSACVTTLISGFVPSGVAIDGGGNLYATDVTNNLLKELPSGCTSSSCLATVGGAFNDPVAVAVDGNGNIYVSDYSETIGQGAVRKVPPGCTSLSCMVTLATVNYPHGLAVDVDRNVYIYRGDTLQIEEIHADCTSDCVTIWGPAAGARNIAVDGSGNVYPGYMAVDNSGNLYSGGGNQPFLPVLSGTGTVYPTPQNPNQVYEVFLASPPSLAFAKTNAGSQSSPANVILWNIGNAPLTFPVPGSGADPSISDNFTLDASTTCPQVTASSPAGSLAAGASCNLAVDFAPTGGGTLTGSVVLTDNNLSVANATQSIALSGTGVNGLLPYIQVNNGAWQNLSTINVSPGDTVSLGEQILTGGSYNWSGPGGYTSTSRIASNVPLTSTSNAFTLTYTNTAGATSTLTFTIKVGGTALTPYIQVNNGGWQPISTVTVSPGSTVNLGEQMLTGGSYSWTGPGGYSSSSRIAPSVPLNSTSDVFTLTYTNTVGATSTATFTINVGSTPLTPYIQVNNGSWQPIATVTVGPGSTVNLGEQMLTGGSYSWTGPGGYTSTSRIASNVPLNSATNTFTLTYTNSAGSTSTAIFTVKVGSTPLTPYIQVSNGSWQPIATVTVSPGSTVNLGEQVLTGGSYSWTGPGGFSSTARVVTNVPLTSGINIFTLTYTNTVGASSTATFTITLN